mmetsp:Transcript_475/g.1146  ORF Transcript_475/g.1146 Transcript_475/m.1146 type:complete len:129 (-) Transcript_475:467-853(-)
MIVNVHGGDDASPYLVKGANGHRFRMAPWAVVMVMTGFGKNPEPLHDDESFEYLSTIIFKLGARVETGRPTVGDLVHAEKTVALQPFLKAQEKWLEKAHMGEVKELWKWKIEEPNEKKEPDEDGEKKE